MPTMPDWRDTGGYDYIAALDSAGWAWEFMGATSIIGPTTGAAGGRMPTVPLTPPSLKLRPAAAGAFDALLDPDLDATETTAI